jgi:hypothetical protein
MTNPFRLRWLEGWTFQVVLMEGHVQVEAQGFGITLRTPVFPQEAPQAAADRLVLDEDRRRRAMRQAWLRGQDSIATNQEPRYSNSDFEGSIPVSLVVVGAGHRQLVA